MKIVVANGTSVLGVATEGGTLDGATLPHDTQMALTALQQRLPEGYLNLSPSSPFQHDRTTFAVDTGHSYTLFDFDTATMPLGLEVLEVLNALRGAKEASTPEEMLRLAREVGNSEKLFKN